MIYSETHFWFENVRWNEHDTTIQCLVDTSLITPEEGFYLVEDNNSLSIYPANELSMHTKNSARVLGRAIRWSVYEKNFSGEKRA